MAPRGLPASRLSARSPPRNYADSAPPGGTALGTCLSMVAAAQAGTHALKCEGDGLSLHPNGTARYVCAIHKVKPNVSVTLSKGQENRDCDRYRAFEALSSGGLLIKRVLHL